MRDAETCGLLVTDERSSYGFGRRRSMLPRRAFDERENSTVCDHEILLPDVRGRGERRAWRVSEMWNGPRAQRHVAHGSAIYTCPMHPEVERDHPGNCPICGMALEPKTVSRAPEENAELADMTRRFWIGAVLTLPVFLLGMAHLVPSAPHWVGGDVSRWMQFRSARRSSLGRLAFLERGWRRSHGT